MLSRKKRVVRSQFPLILKGKSLHSGFFSLKLLGTSPSLATFSVVVSKKVAPHAVDRNKLRRRFLSVIEKMYPSLSPESSGVFFLKKGVEKTTYKQLETEIISFFDQAGFLKSVAPKGASR